MIAAGSHTGGRLSKFDPTMQPWLRDQNDPNDPHNQSSNNVYDVYEDLMEVLRVNTGEGDSTILMAKRKMGQQILPTIAPSK